MKPGMCKFRQYPVADMLGSFLTSLPRTLNFLIGFRLYGQALFGFGRIAPCSPG